MRPIPLKPLRHRKFWVILWLCAIVIVIILSLIPPPSLLMNLPKNSDKIEHFLAYFILAFSATQLFYKGRFLWLIGVLLVLLGISLEWAQGVLTRTRMADPWDGLANTLGVVIGLSSAFSPLANILLRLQSKPSEDNHNTV